MLPNPDMNFTSFDILTAEEMNELVANIESISDATGIEDGVILTRHLGQSVVTSDKIDFTTVGVKIGVISGSTLNTTGNKTISGVGFRPRLVRFTQLPSYSDTAVRMSIGAMDSSGSQYFSTSASFSGNNSSWAGTTRALASIASAGGIQLEASYVSMDNDGFTINVISPSNVASWAYEAIQ